MSKADGKCNKCKGKGLVDAPVLHFGVPGLCYRCDGAGTYEAEAANKAKARQAKAEAAEYQVVMEKVWAVKKAIGNRHPLTQGFEARKVLRDAIGKGQVTSTRQVAAALGVTPREAFDGLCAFYPQACPTKAADGSWGWAWSL